MKTGAPSLLSNTNRGSMFNVDARNGPSLISIAENSQRSCFAHPSPGPQAHPGLKNEKGACVRRGGGGGGEGGGSDDHCGSEGARERGGEGE